MKEQCKVLRRLDKQQDKLAPNTKKKGNIVFS